MVTGLPPLRATRVAGRRASTRSLLSSGGVTRLPRYYEAIRLPRADSPPPLFGSERPSGLQPETRGPPGLPCRLRVAHAMVSDPGEATRAGRAPSTRRAGFALSCGLPPCTTASAFPSSAISGLSPFSLGLTAYALAALRLKVGLESHPGLGRTCSLPSKGSLPGGDLLTGAGFPPARLHNLAQSLRARARARYRTRDRANTDLHG